MHTKKKKMILALVLVGYVVITAIIGTMYNENKEAQRRLAEAIQSIPPGIYLTGLAVFLAGMFFLLWQMVYGIPRFQERFARLRALRAKNTAKSLWIVRNRFLNGDSVIIEFSHYSFNTNTFMLPIRPGHPDIEKFRKLKENDVVEFVALDRGLDCALPSELCGYLRIVSVQTHD